MKLFKCLNCRSDAVDEIIRGNKILYKCYTCGKILPQVYSIDSRIKFEIDHNRQVKHFMTAIILRNKENKILMLHRRAFPFVWSLIMGHLHNGENKQQGIERELMEEAAVSLNNKKYLFTLEVDDQCDIGVLAHRIDVFEGLISDETLIIPNSEAREVKWVAISELATNQGLKKMSGKAKAILKQAKFLKNGG